VPPVAPEQQRYTHSAPQSSVAPFSPALTSGPSQSLQDTAPLQTSIASLRQDSAVAQYRVDNVKEAETTLPSSVFAFSYFHPAANSCRQSNTSRPISHPAGPSSPHSPASEPRSNQAPPETGPHSLGRGHSQSLSSGTHVSVESARSPEHVAGPSAAANTDAGSKSTLLSPTLDQANGSNRHQRYNVRFNTVYTSENMPPNQKPRHDPPPTAPLTTEPNESQTPAQEPTVRLSVEPATPSITPAVLQPTEDQPQSQQRSNAPQLERCSGCKEAWKRPLPGEEQYRLSSPAQNRGDQVALTQDLITRLQNHAKMADEAYTSWQRKHRWCTETAPSPSATEVPVDSRSKSEEEPLRTDASTYTPSTNKRKSEVPHDPSKYRKVVSFDTQSNATPHIRPTAPA
jgi:hypothetical protein